MKKIIYFLLLFFIFLPSVYAKENLVNIYLFHSNNCNHCKEEIKLLNELEKEYDNIRVYKYEISEDDNQDLLNNVSSLLKVNVRGVPFTIVGNKYFSGFSEVDGKKKFVAAIEYYSQYGYKDMVGEYIGVEELPNYEINKEEVVDAEDFICNFGNYKIKLPLFGEIDTDDLSLPIIAILLGLIDGVSLNSIVILLFLIGWLIGIKDRKKLFVYGLTFLLVSILFNFVLLILDFDINSFVQSNVYFKYVTGIFIILLGLYKMLNKKIKIKNKNFNKIIKFIKSKNSLLSVICIIILTILINIVLGLSKSSSVFEQILYLNDLPKILEILYNLSYVIYCFIGGFIIFFVILFLKKNKKLNVISNILMLLVGLIIIFI